MTRVGSQRHRKKTNEMHTFPINVLIQFLVPSTCFEHCGFIIIRKTICTCCIVMFCLCKQSSRWKDVIDISIDTMVFLMVNPQCSKHVEDTKN